MLSVQPARTRGDRSVYRALKGIKDIRLVTIRPGTWNEEICCALSHYSLGEQANPVYSALSYVWGSPKVTDQILLNGEPWRVTVNLFHALHFLRDAETPVRIWIDALVRTVLAGRALLELRLTRLSASIRATLSSEADKSS